MALVGHHRYLGIKVDEALGWKSHVDVICKKYTAGMGALKRIRSLVPCQTLLRMYEALVTPCFDYCSEVQGCMGKGLCDRLQRLQNMAGRIITFSEYKTRYAIFSKTQDGTPLSNRSCSKQLAIRVVKSLNNLRVLRTCLNQPPGFIPTTYKVPRTMFLQLGSAQKLLSRLLAIGGQSCGMASKMSLKTRKISTLSSLSCLCLELGIALREL